MYCEAMKVKELKEYFEKRKDVLLAYLFGSSVQNVESAKDIDVAVLLDERRIKKDSFDVGIEIWLDLIPLLERSDIDVVVLNDASPLLKHEVIKNGQVLFEKKPEIRWDFEVSSELNFFDLEPMRKLFWESLVRRVKEGKFLG